MNWIHVTAAFALGLLSAFAAFHSILRKYLRMRQSQSSKWEERFLLQKQQIRDGNAQLIEMAKELALRTVEFDKLLHKVHHGVQSFPKRFRGLLNIQKYPMEQAKQQMVQACKPNHEQWARLAITSFKEVEEIQEKMEEVCLKLEDYMGETASEFEHLQSP